MKRLGKLISIISMISILSIPFTNVYAKTKNETVYTNLDSYGNIEKTSITNHLFVKDTGVVEDETELKEILNINGEETYQLSEKGFTWNTFGKDIFYRGTIEKTLPIEVTITYYLNDKEMDIKDMIGKAGKVKIQMNFQNNIKQQVEENGIHATLYTPFVVTTGIILKNDENVDIEINNGKIIDSGTRSIVLGLAAPGMYENFKINELKDLDKIVLNYETKNFSLGDIYIVATPKLLEESDFKIFDQVSGISKKISTLQSSMDEIEKGVKKLEEGSNGLTGGSTELVKGLKSALDGVSQLEVGAIQVDEGLQKVIAQLQNVSISLNNPTMAGSITNLQMLKGKNNDAKNNLIAQTGMDYNSLMSYYQANLINYTGTDTTMLTLKSTCEFILLLDANNQAITQTLTFLTSIDSQVESILITLTNALIELEKGSQQLSTGLTQVKSGLERLYDGSKEFNKGMQALGIGVSELKTGITRFNQEGIQTLTRYSKTMNSYSNRIKAVLNLSENYQGYASHNVDNTTFVYMIKSYKKNSK